MMSQTIVRPPLAGYNHNVRYGARVFHVQTEDSGVAHPHVFTHLFLNGMIVASLRLDYDDLVGEAGHEGRLRNLMQEQHKRILKQLRRGMFDERIGGLMQVTAPAEPVVVVPPTVEAPAVAAAAPAADAAAAPAVAPAVAPTVAPTVAPVPVGDRPASGIYPIVAGEQPMYGVEDTLVGYPTPDENESLVQGMTEEELQNVRRGQAISLGLASAKTDSGIIPLDHLAFGGFPMLELDDTDDDDAALELDLDSVARPDLVGRRGGWREIDLDGEAPPPPSRSLGARSSSHGVPAPLPVLGAGEELDLELELDGEAESELPRGEAMPKIRPAPGREASAPRPAPRDAPAPRPAPRDASAPQPVPRAAPAPRRAPADGSRRTPSLPPVRPGDVPLVIKPHEPGGGKGRK